MVIRIVLGVLLVALLGLQYRLWVADSGLREVWRLEKAIDAQQLENATLSDRNSTLAAEVRDLKEGRTAIEERARTDLGMIGANETFFQVIGPSTPPDADSDSAQDRRTAQALAPSDRE